MSTKVQKQYTARTIQLTSRPDEVPTEANFELVTRELSPPGDGEFMVKNEWISVDPYMRGRMKEGDSYVAPFELGEPLEGGCVGQVVASRHDRFAEGDYVLGNLGWRDYWKSSGAGVVKVDPQLASPQAYLGVLGMTGMTAWVGLKRIAKLKPGSTVFVSAASGAVGSIVCQIAKANDCRVIGSAGKSEKIDWLREQAKVDEVINYKETNDLTKALGELAPEGIDVYFDNVGGEHLEAALEQMNDFGCCVECGMISTYNATKPPVAPRNLFKIITKRIRMQGFIVRDHMSDQDEFLKDMSALIKSGNVVWEESVREGLEETPKAFIGLFSGENLGKSLVHIQ
ncbi:putative NADP-dependent oxidoreductase YfmJ [Novipirellula galeiformis]|uniref:Putative NADP-dependent oxidoreductase YfmJ n=1 Tax=Novipirellula galeiformis TaxID=2528004 RepID=A0A5C6CP04_9BACT|nr:NADP-dependent oxidoreductase [Novipirellula galeiformis]TWU25111.1 putative NADP-dependent oxidoreductase YfmJ [Novipirellula galeiformis]